MYAVSGIRLIEYEPFPSFPSTAVAVCTGPCRITEMKGTISLAAKCNESRAKNSTTHTLGFLYSFGLMHRMKNGWHADRVLINSSRDVLNCSDSVIDRLLESSEFFDENKSKRKLLVDWPMTSLRSKLNASRFFSKKPTQIITRIKNESPADWRLPTCRIVKYDPRKMLYSKRGI